ncbi:MAG: D-aminoacyl-tRNA deacylase [Actinomycetales bacterium]
MRVVLQRVLSATVRVAGEVVGQVDGAQNPSGQALLAFVGVTHGDTVALADKAAAKIAGLRILDAERSAAEVRAAVLVISQFTLYADTAKGRRPSWSAAAPGAQAEPLVDRVVESLATAGLDVATGRFGAQMDVELVNAGPMTILLEF